MAWRRARIATGGGGHFAGDLDAVAQGCAAALQIGGVLVTSIEGEAQRVLGVHGLPSHVLRGAMLVPANPSCRVVAATGKPRLVQDGRVRHVDDPARLGAVAYAGLPVATRAGAVVLAAIDRAPRAWCERDVSVLRGFAAIAASTIDGQTLQRRCAQLEHERDEADLLLALATLGGSPTLGTALSRLARHVGWECVDALLIDGDQLRSHGAHVDDLALEALARIERGETFDLGVLDYFMPEMDGVALAAAIRRHRDHASLRLLLLSSARQSGAALQDFDRVRVKPLRRSALLDTFLDLLAPAQTAGAQTSARPPIVAAESGARPLRILLVEDNAINRQVGTRMLESLGYRADVCENGAEAVEALHRKPYDLVLMDIHMPVMDGLEATRRIRAMSGILQPRIFAMTASVLDDERQACVDAGMDRHLAKPFRRHELEKALRDTASG